MTEKQRAANTSLLKAVSVLKEFARSGPELGVSQVADAVQLPPATAHRILSTLVQGELLEWNKATRKYRIGANLYLIGARYLEDTDFLSAAEPVTKIINSLCGEAVNLSVFSDGSITLVHKQESRYAFRISTRIGSTMPAYASSMGKCFLSQLTESQIDALYPGDTLEPLTSKTIRSKEVLKEELARVRETGFAHDWEGSYDGVLGIGSLIRGSDGKGTAGISISLPVIRIDESAIRRYSDLIKMGAEVVSFRLGYPGTVSTTHDVDDIERWWNGTMDNE